MTPRRMTRPRIWRNRPPGAVDCSRSSVTYGNPFVIGVHADDAADAVAKYRAWQLDPDSLPEVRITPSGRHKVYWPQTADTLDRLAGADWLACYCDLDAVCHVTVLLELLADRPAHLRGDR